MVNGITVRTPALRVFSNCRHLIETIPSMVSDGSGQDVKEGGDDHAYDVLVYALLHRPMSARPSRPRYDYTGGSSKLNNAYGYVDTITGY